MQWQLMARDNNSLGIRLGKMADWPAFQSSSGALKITAAGINHVGRNGDCELLP